MYRLVSINTDRELGGSSAGIKIKARYSTMHRYILYKSVSCDHIAARFLDRNTIIPDFPDECGFPFTGAPNLA
jgi:hypothetical protein